jgi:hypothetical protein
VTTVDMQKPPPDFRLVTTSSFIQKLYSVSTKSTRGFEKL